MPRYADPEVTARKEREKADLEAKINSQIPEGTPEDDELDEMQSEAEDLLDEKAKILARIQKIRVEATMRMDPERRRGPKGSREQALWFAENLPRKEWKKKNGEDVEVDSEDSEEGVVLE